MSKRWMEWSQRRWRDGKNLGSEEKNEARWRGGGDALNKIYFDDTKGNGGGLPREMGNYDTDTLVAAVQGALSLCRQLAGKEAIWKGGGVGLRGSATLELVVCTLCVSRARVTAQSNHRHHHRHGLIRAIASAP